MRQPANGVTNTERNSLTKSNQERSLHGLPHRSNHVHRQSLDGATKQPVNDRRRLSEKGVTVAIDAEQDHHGNEQRHETRKQLRA